MRKALLWSLAFMLMVALPAFAGQAAPVKAAQAKSPATVVNLNTASESDLVALPGVGAATAKKIIAGRPYASVADLAKAGVPKNTIEKISPMVTVGVPSSTAAAPPARRPAPAPAAAAPAPGTVVNLNTASESDLVALPGVGAATAKKIIAGRPYTSVADLAKAGVPKSTIEKISSMVTVGAATSAAAAPPARRPAPAPAAAAPAPGAVVNLNTASESDLVALPGVGAATAKKIIAGRPYTSVADLAKAGVPKSTIEKISSMVTVGAATSAAAAPPAPKSAPAPTAPAPAPATTARTPSAPAAAQQPPVKGMVWVNLSTKVFHREGDRYYGNTKNGKFMTEADAVKAGYREAKTEKKKTP